jgi:4-amino-4-deoxy-L-arabinose transferase-like glycosyltransferase
MERSRQAKADGARGVGMEGRSVAMRVRSSVASRGDAIVPWGAKGAMPAVLGNEKRRTMRDRVALTLTAIVAALHLAVANRYDLFRDELYFIVCGRHPAFGYLDQPPLVPLLAAGGYALGGQTWIVRLPAVFAAAALVWVVVAFVRLLGGRDAAAWIAGIAAGLAPMLMGITATLSTTFFETLAWTLVAYGLARAAVLDDRRALLWTGVVAGIAMEAKYSLLLWLIALAVGLALFPERRLFRYRELWLALAIAGVVTVPSVLWQAAHGFPFVELVRNAGQKDLVVTPLAFAIHQVLVFNPLFAPIWLAGVIAPFLLRELKSMRFIAIAFLIAAASIIAGHGKDYYLAGAFPPLLAFGGIAIVRLIRNTVVRVGYVAVAVIPSLLLAPFALPILSPNALVAYEHALHFKIAAQERGDSGDLVPSLFADMLGWHDFVREVGAAYVSLPPQVRAHTSVLVDNYGEAAALDIYGAPYGLPPALSGHNQYFLWGERGQDPANLIRVQSHPERLRPYCREMTVFRTTQSPYARDFENGKAIAFCRGLHPSLATIWPSLKNII